MLLFSEEQIVKCPEFIPGIGRIETALTISPVERGQEICIGRWCTRRLASPDRPAIAVAVLEAHCFPCVFIIDETPPESTDLRCPCESERIIDER